MSDIRNETVLREVDAAGVATLRLNRPEVNNAYDGEMIAALTEAVAVCARDEAVRVVVLRGNGRHFQAGADLKWIERVGQSSELENVAVSRRTAVALRGLNEIGKPTVALVHGGCFGGGVGLVASCDVVLASLDAVFAITEVHWGLTPAIIVPQLNAAMGVRNVRRYALSGERFGAERARSLGLVNEVCAEGALDDTAAPILDRLLRGAPEAVAETKRDVLSFSEASVSGEAFDGLVERHGLKRRSAEAREGTRCFREKREPGWYRA